VGDLARRAPVDAPEVITRHDHAVCTEEHKRWRDQIQRWKRENEEVLKTFQELEAMIVKRGQELAGHLQKIQDHEDVEQTHELLETVAPGDAGLDESLERVHEQYVEGHLDEREVLAVLEEKHQRVLDHVMALREILQDSK
jgi:predicted patatin/cPLA2 family phospholipase